MKPWRAPLDARNTRPLEGGASFALSHRTFRAVWTVAWILLARWTPPPLHPWRRLVLRAFGARLAPGVRVYASVRVWYPPNLEMGSCASLGPGVTCYAMDHITIGAYATVSQGAQICAGSHDVASPDFQLVTRPVTVGAYAWVAADAFVGPGVRIGEGAVLGARGVAFRDLDPWTIYAGNPARPLRPRAWAEEAGA